MLVNLENVTLKRTIGVKNEVSKKGNDYTIGEFIVEYEMPDKQYPVRLLLKAFGDTANQVKTLKEGSKVSLEAVVSTREYNGRYYTDCICEKFLGLEEAKKPTAKKESKKPVESADPFSIKSDLNSIEDDSLPF